MSRNLSCGFRGRKGQDKQHWDWLLGEISAGPGVEGLFPVV